MLKAKAEGVKTVDEREDKYERKREVGKQKKSSVCAVKKAQGELARWQRRMICEIRKVDAGIHREMKSEKKPAGDN